MIHPIDAYIGLKRFFTSTIPPCRIWLQRPEDFHVIEIPKVYDVDENLYLLLKQNVDTFNAIEEIEKGLGGRWVWSGLKDSNAITVQHVSSKVDVGEWRWKRKNKCLYLKKIGKGGVKRGDLKANLFIIRLRSKCDIEGYVKETLDEMKDVPGIYSYQRFGTRRPITHVVGKMVLLGRWEEAINVLLGEPTPWESERAREVRRLYYEMGPKAYLDAPPYLNIERKVARALLKGLPPRKALLSLPQFEIFLGAFQAYIYNKALTDLKWYNRTPGYDTYDLYKEYFKEEGIEKRSLKKFKVRSFRRSPKYNAKVVLRKSAEGLFLIFTLPKGYYATTLLREIIKGDPKEFS
ncbi:hypothetical protein IPA_03995 [Ignicoccus pacificus DSM 13166]|uniref:TRUD domain-containing protein n=1 Tax=Ignicoccus pacificus DSM 13166 TaxID=940294 RepID=A0A977KB61_9CREN|nr:hypothetical protein IPA_03995 [Ignicoccus pacificus DSM 13166]